MKSERDSDTEAFIENIYFLRTHYGYTKKAMARLSGISVNSLTKLENGTIPNCITVTAVYNIAKHFNIPMSSLFTKIQS